MSSGGGGSSSNTVTQVQQIPEFAQDFSRQNYDLAQSLGAQQYPVYDAPLIQGFSPLQQQGQAQAVQASTAYQPYLNAATGVTQQALDPSAFNAYSNVAGGQTSRALDPSNMNALSGMSLGTMGQALQTNAATPGAIDAYMSPYVQASLAPQMNALQMQLAQQQKGIDSQATQAGAFGDARHGVAQATQNYYGNQAMNELLGSGYNSAYNTALQALGQQQQAGLSAAGQMGNLASLQGQQQQTQLAGADMYRQLAALQQQQAQTQLAGGQQLAGLGSAAQEMGLTGAGATYTAGEQEQLLGQQQLNAAYQQYLNQVNWPFQMLNVRESALSNNPYNIATSVQLPQANTAAQGFGSMAGIAGLLGSLGSGSGGGRSNVFGAQG